MRTATFVGCVLVGLATTAGCSAPTDEPGTSGGVSDLAQGLTVLEARPDVSFSAAYRRGDNVIYLQALQGRATPQAYQKDLDSPKYEIDARFDADNGRTFYSRKGGDDWIDPTWPQDFERQNALPPTRVSNEALFAMAAEAADLLDSELPGKVGAPLFTSLEPVVHSLRDFGKAASATFAEQKQRRIDMAVRDGLTAPEATMGEVAYGTNGPEDQSYFYGANYYYIEVHDKDIYWNIGRHSATRLYQWLGYWAWVHDNCNHGECAGTMGYKCHLEYYEAVQDYKPAWTLQSCSTGYSWASDGGGHNCHDDTRLQMNNFVYNSINSGTQGWCNDGDSSTDISVDIWGVELDQSGSPECNSSTNKGYNHPTWMPGASTAYTCTPGTDRLCAGESLYAGQSRTSSDGRFILVYQGDGNLVLYQTSDWRAIWASSWQSGWYGHTPGATSMQGDGNFVIYTSGWSPVWSSKTAMGPQGLFLVVQSDGNVVIYDPYWRPFWSTGTGGR